jgi:hypothetical protein
LSVCYAWSCEALRIYSLRGPASSACLPVCTRCCSELATLFVAVRAVKGLGGRQGRIGTEKMVCMLHGGGMAWHGYVYVSLRHYFSRAVSVAALFWRKDG